MDASIVMATPRETGCKKILKMYGDASTQMGIRTLLKLRLLRNGAAVILPSSFREMPDEPVKVLNKYKRKTKT